MTDAPAKPRVALFPYYPALDGLRGYFLIAVVLFHAGWSFSGALLTMSGFFVLSGFLIASLLIAEYERYQRINVGQFLLRRARRLLPASMISIVLIGVLWNSFDLRNSGAIDPDEVARHTNIDLLSATFYVYNWRTINGPSWGGFGAFPRPNPPESSPISHFWSLAVEEQFYLFFPFIALLALGVMGGRRALGVISGTGIVLAIAFQPTLEGKEGIDRFTQMDRIYQGTDVRMAEFLIGALMAVAFSYPLVRRWLADSRLVMIVGIAVFALMTYWLFVIEIFSFWLYDRGRFAFIGALFGVIIFALTQPSGPLVRLLDNPVLRWLGQRSYGMYVYHFTLMRLFDHELLGWSRWPLLILQVSLTVIAGALSYTYVEQPIRRGYWPWQRQRMKAHA